MKARPTQKYPPYAADRRRAGSVLVLALWCLFLLSALALAVSSRVTASLRLAEAVRRSTRGLWLARAGVAAAASRVAGNTNSWDGAHPDSWNMDPEWFLDNRTVEEGRFSVRVAADDSESGSKMVPGILGEERRININEVDSGVLAALFRHVGRVSSRRAEALAEALVSWRSQPRGEQAEEGAPHGGGFRSVQELGLVEGIDPNLFVQVQPWITIFGSGKINVNIAGEDVIIVLAESRGVTGRKAIEAARAIAAARPQPSLEQLISECDEVGKLVLRRAGDLATVESTCFSGTALGSIGGDNHDLGDDASADGRIDFVLDDRGAVVFWHEQ